MSFIPFANSPCSLYQGIGPQWLGQACLAILPLRSGVFWCAGARGLCWFSRLRRTNNSGPGEVDPKPIQKLSAIHSETTIQKLFPPIQKLQKLTRFRNYDSETIAIQRLSRFRNYRDSKTISRFSNYHGSANTIQKLRDSETTIQKLYSDSETTIQKPSRFRNYCDSETNAIQKLSRFRNYRGSETDYDSETIKIQKLSRFRKTIAIQKLSRFRNLRFSNYDSDTIPFRNYRDSETIPIRKLSRFIQKLRFRNYRDSETSETNAI